MMTLEGYLLRRRGLSGRSGRLAGVRRELVDHPFGAELVAPVGASANAHVVARARVERQRGLDRIPLVVLADQLVDVIEGPRLGACSPAAGELLGLVAPRPRERPVRALDAATLP